MNARALGEPELRRLRWRARRGLLENDLILGRYFDRESGRIGAEEAGALEALLELPDNELLDLLLARKEPWGALDNNSVRALLTRLRTA
jgi:antitoxin CptB